MAKNHRLGGIDIGGTKIHCVVAKPNGEILGRARKKLAGERELDRVVERARACLKKACKRAGMRLADLDGIGVGAPSAISRDGMAVNAPNLGWQNEPLVPRLTKRFGMPVAADNDCNSAALGEHRFGSGRGAQTMVAMLMGTGLGGGIIHHGEILAGTNRLAAEIGHQIVDARGRTCGCGHVGCLEAYASKTGIGARLRELIEVDGRDSSLTKEPEINLRNPRSGLLAGAYRAGDEVAREVLTEAAWYLGVGVANVITLLGPDRIVLGGGVLEALGHELIETIRASARAATFPPPSFEDSEIVLSTLGDDAVALGAVVMAGSD